MKHKKKKKINFPAKYVLLIMSLFCLVIIGCSVKLSLNANGATTVIGYVIIPMQKGINKAGTALNKARENLISKQTLQAENEELQAQVDELQSQLNEIQLDKEELNSLRDLYDMDQNFSAYDKLAATVIGKDSGNWFSTYILDKGSNDGVEEGMNIIADGGLAGIVIEVGPNYSKVRSIIDDASNVSAKDLNTSDLCIVSGGLKVLNETGLIEFSDLSDSDDEVTEGDQIVTSNVSDLYLEGIPIGYITDVTMDSNKLTKSGHLATIVDFEHLDKVFILMETKESVTENKGE